jgi:hypothetical protein
VSTKQFIFPFGVERLTSAPVLADAGVAGTLEERLELLELCTGILANLALHQLGNEFRQTLAARGGLDAGAVRQRFIQRDGDVLHDEFLCYT